MISCFHSLVFKNFFRHPTYSSSGGDLFLRPNESDTLSLSLEVSAVALGLSQDPSSRSSSPEPLLSCTDGPDSFGSSSELTCSSFDSLLESPTLLEALLLSRLRFMLSPSIWLFLASASFAFTRISWRFEPASFAFACISWGFEPPASFAFARISWNFERASLALACISWGVEPASFAFARISWNFFTNSCFFSFLARFCRSISSSFFPVTSSTTSFLIFFNFSGISSFTRSAASSISSLRSSKTTFSASWTSRSI
mmetsp:Transcript_38915/g.71311  ORF Transcript_38915/g.71311 Transcript_38915/m.71311 type:complete len:256 (-) Transcript_38915:874-1641(-)